MLLIGGTGFFGKSFLDAYRRGILQKWSINKVYVVARNAKSLKVLHPQLITREVELIDLDICCTANLPYADYVIHAAASTNAKNYILNSNVEMSNIINGAKNYCAVAKKNHTKSKIVYVSSGAVYGSQPIKLCKFPENYSTQTSLSRMAENKIHYASAKRNAECLIRQLGSDGLSVSIARCFSFVGSYLPRDQHFAVGNFIANGLANESIVVKAKEKVIRSYLYADDLVCWLMYLAESANSACPIWNVGSDQAISILDLAYKVASRFGVEVLEPPCLTASIDRYVPSIKNALLAGMKFDSIDLALEKTINCICETL